MEVVGINNNNNHEEEENVIGKRKRETETKDENENKSTEQEEYPAKKAKTQETSKLSVNPPHSGWFDIQKVSDLEKKEFPEFFDGSDPKKTSELYVKYRNYMVRAFRENPIEYLSSTKCRSVLTGDAITLMKIHSFLEHWGIINFGVNPQAEETELTKSVEMKYKEMKNGNKTEMSELIKLWSKEEILALLDAVEKEDGKDWNKIAAGVGTKSKEECLKFFSQLPIEDKFLREIGDIPKTESKMKSPIPFFDRSNPIMATTAFLISTCDDKLVEKAIESVTGKKKKIEDLDVKTMSSVALGMISKKAEDKEKEEDEKIKTLLNEIVEKQIDLVNLRLQKI